MSKRRPDVQLTKDNFDQEFNNKNNDDGDDDVGVTNEPKIASDEVLKNRSIVKAKRRLASDNNVEGNGPSGIFSSFKCMS